MKALQPVDPLSEERKQSEKEESRAVGHTDDRADTLHDHLSPSPLATVPKLAVTLHDFFFLLVDRMLQICKLFYFGPLR